MLGKPDWQEARARWTALWEGRYDRRPCMAVKAPRPGAPHPPPPPADPWRRWIDPEWVAATARAQIDGTYFGGEAIPSAWLQASWLLCYHAPVRLQERTIWIDPLPFDLRRPPTFALDFESEGVKSYERVLKRVAEELGPQGVLIQPSGGLPADDLLSLLIGTENFLMCLHDDREWLDATLAGLERNRMLLYRRFRDLVRRHAELWYGVGWDVFWGPEPFLSTQSDVSCMLSPEQFASVVLPSIRSAGEEYGRLWYHLDGPGAIRHLDLLLEQPFMSVIQWVPGAGAAPNGPAWLDLYRRVQRAGRIVHVNLPPENVEPLVRELDPALVCYATSCRSPAEAEELLSAAEKWVGARSRAAHVARAGGGATGRRSGPPCRS